MFKKLLLGLALAMAALLALVYAFPEKSLALALGAERNASGLTEQTITVGEDQWHVLSGGPADTTPLVLVHGFGGNADHWTRTARSLTPSMRVIAPDLIGFGSSSAPAAGDYRIGTQVERLHALLQQMGVTKAHFGGNSMGGWIIGSYAARYPDEVASLWLLDPAGVVSTPSEMSVYAAQGHALPLIVRSPEDFDARMGWVFVNPPPVPGPLKAVLMTQDIARADHYAKVRDQLYGVSAMLDTVLPESGATNIPSLIVWGEQDRVLHPDGALALQAYLPNSDRLMMPNVGHCPMLEVPEQTASDYLAWRAQRGF